MPTAVDLELLRKYDTPTVCNVIELFAVRPRTAGYLDGRVGACFPRLPPMVGYAATATFRSAAPPRAGDVYSGLEKQIASLTSSPGPPVIVVQDLDDPPAAAVFGEVMCSTYKAFGAAGLVTGGAGRDLDQVETLAFPCFTSGTICAHGYCHIPDINIPVRVGGLTVHPGDLLHGDRNGVTSVPTEIASAVAHACAEFTAAEAVVLDYLKAGRIEAKGYAESRAECAARIEALAQRVGRR
jgi:regulator of RNase E activity RraA